MRCVRDLDGQEERTLGMTTRQEKKLWQIEFGLMILAAAVALGLLAYQRFF